MRTTIRRAAILGSLIAALSLAQQPAFDAASVKAIDPAHRDQNRRSGGPGTSDPGRIHYPNERMISLLTTAYGVEIDRVFGPAWIWDFMGPNAYTIDATMPPGTTKEQFALMMQNLLTERFHLAVHHETRNFPGYDLVIAKGGSKLKETTQDPDAVAPDTPQRPAIGKDGSATFPPGTQSLTRKGIGTVLMKCQAIPVSNLVQHLWAGIPEAMGADLMDFSVPRARVTDKTGLTGKYDFTLEYACKGCRGLGAMAANLPLLAGRAQSNPPPAADPASNGLPNIFAALEKQLGLKLEKTHDISLDVIVVDRVDKVPTQN
jgi:uncharacterized protein (TIGR03435 family)